MTLKTYKEINESYQMEDDNLKFKNKFGIFIFSLLFSFMIISIPAIILINLLIFKDYVRLTAFFIALDIILFLYLFELFYDIGITKGKIKDIYVLPFTHIIFEAIVVFLIYIILILMEVI